MLERTLTPATTAVDPIEAALAANFNPNRCADLLPQLPALLAGFKLSERPTATLAAWLANPT